jgi:uncharacterized membrane protein
MLDLIKSKRFWMAVIGVAVPLVNDRFGLNLTDDQVWQIVAVLLGVSAVDSYRKIGSK